MINENAYNETIAAVSHECIVVKTKSEAKVSKARSKAKFSVLGVEEETEIPHIRAKRVKVHSSRMDEVLEKLRNDPDIQYAEKDSMATACVLSQAQKDSALQYLKNIKVHDAWSITEGCSEVRVAVLDTGVNDHPAFGGRVIHGYNVAAPNNPTKDGQGHGTWVSSCVLANFQSLGGWSGIAPKCKVVAYKISQGETKDAFNSDIAAAIIRAVNDGLRIINISFGSVEQSTPVFDAVTYAWNNNAIIFASAGNEGNSVLNYPAAYPLAISVGAVTNSDQKASFSSFGPTVDIVAPGHQITAGNKYYFADVVNGTSFSSPFTAGVAALILSVDPNFTNHQVKDFIFQGADPLAIAEFPNAGRINVLNSVTAARAASTYNTYLNFNVDPFTRIVEFDLTWDKDDVEVEAVVEWPYFMEGDKQFKYGLKLRGSTYSVQATVTASDGATLETSPYLLEMPLYANAIDHNLTHHSIYSQSDSFTISYLGSDLYWYDILLRNTQTNQTVALITGGETVPVNVSLAGVPFGFYEVIFDVEGDDTFLVKPPVRIVVWEPGLAASSVTSNSFLLSFNPIQGALGYKILKNGVRWPNNKTTFVSATIAIPEPLGSDTWAVMPISSEGVASASTVPQVVTPPPEAHPKGGRFQMGQTVTLTGPAGGTIIYTLDGSDPRHYIPTNDGKAVFDESGVLVLTDEPYAPDI